MKELHLLTEKAELFLRTAQKALEVSDYDSCASRSYYAMFFMAEAVLLTRGLAASSHKGVITLFGQHFARTGAVERWTGRALNEAYDKRLLGDYGIGFMIAAEEARKLVQTATDFVRQLKGYLDEWEKEQEKKAQRT